MAALQRCFESIDEKATLAVQPSFLLHEIKKKQSRENQERLAGRCVVRLLRKLRTKDVIDFMDCGPESIEELTGERFAIECAIEKPCVIRSVRRRQKIQTIDGVLRWIAQIDIEAPKLTMRREIVNGDAIAV